MPARPLSLALPLLYLKLLFEGFYVQPVNPNPNMGLTSGEESIVIRQAVSSNAGEMNQHI